MPREAALFEDCDGSPVEDFAVWRKDGGNIPPAWIERSRESRRNRQQELGQLLHSRGSLDAITNLREWEIAFRKECFYLGLRILLELERKGSSEL